MLPGGELAWADEGILVTFVVQEIFQVVVEGEESKVMSG